MADPLDGHWVTINGAHVFIGAPTERGREGVTGTAGASKSDIAAASQKKMSTEKMRVAIRVQDIIARAINGDTIPDNKAFDIIKGRNLIEVKTVIHGSNDKITMHPESLARKLAVGGYKRWTFVVDVRGTEAQYYLYDGVGSFRFNNRIAQPIPLWQMKYVFGG
jgi:hypothetical protein